MESSGAEVTSLFPWARDVQASIQRLSLASGQRFGNVPYLGIWNKNRIRRISNLINSHPQVAHQMTSPVWIPISLNPGRRVETPQHLL